jgi:DNA-binding CsgD family transcriptional regulator
MLAPVVAGAASGPGPLGLGACGLAIECELVPVAESRLVGLVDAVAVLLFRESSNEQAELNARLARRFELTRQESIIAGQLLGGVETREIAGNLGIAYETVRSHAKRIYAKAGVKGRAGLSGLVQSLRGR